MFSHVSIYKNFFLISQDMNGDLDENICYGFLKLVFLEVNNVLLNNV